MSTPIPLYFRWRGILLDVRDRSALADKYFRPALHISFVYHERNRAFLADLFVESRQAGPAETRAQVMGCVEPEVPSADIIDRINDVPSGFVGVVSVETGIMPTDSVVAALLSSQEFFNGIGCKRTLEKDSRIPVTHQSAAPAASGNSKPIIYSVF